MIFGEAPRLLGRAMTERNLGLAALALDMCVPPLALFMLVAMTAFAASAAFLWIARTTLPLLLATAALAIFGAAVILAWTRFGRAALSFAEMASAPFYALWKIPLYLRFLVKREAQWIRTRRDADSSSPEVAHRDLAQPATAGEAKAGFAREVYCLLGVPVDAVNMGDALQRVRDASARRSACFISTPNLNFLISCRSDTQFRDSIVNCDLCIADGMPLVWMARLLDIPIRERVPGSGLFEQLRRDPSKPLSVYFFGGADGVAAKASQMLNSERSAMTCVGYQCPGFGSVEDMSSDETIAQINASGADFLVVALGAKKGQAWIERNRARITIPIVSHLGATINFAAGTVQRAPLWMQTSGLEWLWRIKEEPALWRRYFFDGLAFARLLATRVIPFFAYMRLARPRRADIDNASIAIREGAVENVVRITGAWTHENLDPLRGCFSRAVADSKDIRMDMEDVTYVDASFLGLLLLLYGAQRRRGKRFRCGPLSGRVRKIMELGCCEYLLGEAAPASAANVYQNA
jgi:N-acetylglucosaminyldiphosphoundecaprenol N-acetyl-beta-D-mannosaminyltransferase